MWLHTDMPPSPPPPPHLMSHTNPFTHDVTCICSGHQALLLGSVCEGDPPHQTSHHDNDAYGQNTAGEGRGGGGCGLMPTQGHTLPICPASLQKNKCILAYLQANDQGNFKAIFLPGKNLFHARKTCQAFQEQSSFFSHLDSNTAISCSNSLGCTEILAYPINTKK